MKIPLVSAVVGLWLAVSPSSLAAGKPNVLLIVADDLGYGELTAQGFTKQVPTPNIDAIAANGVRFTDGYVTGTYCSPTRAALLTGRYQQRFGHEFNPAGGAGAGGENIGLSTAEKTMADRLRPAGYATGWFGKSHLGSAPPFHPLKRGFDTYYGFLGGAHSYLQVGNGSANAILRGTEPVPSIDYTTDAFAREAAQFIGQQKDKPWFVYLAFNAVHSPLETLEKYEAKFSAIGDPKRRKFAAMLAALDEGVGTVMAKVRELKQEENTLVFFFSDNGGPTAQTSSANGPLRGFKAQTWEGGIRVPFMMQWKGTVPAGKVDHRPVIQLDVLPTALAAAGIEPQPEWKLEGVNLLPFLKGEKADPPHSALFWRFGGQMAVRSGDWKLVKGPERAGRGSATSSGAELYTLADDLGEKTNVAAQNAEKVRELAALWDTWNAENVAPKWGGSGGPPGRANRGIRRADAAAGKASTAPKGPWKSGDSVDSASAPAIAGKALEISAEIETTATDGVILAQGGRGQGVALYLVAGKPTLGLRAGRQLSKAEATDKLGPGRHTVAATLGTDGAVAFTVDGKAAGAGKVAGPVPAQPGEPLNVGFDDRTTVGDYDGPHALAGKVENATLTVR